MTDEPKKSLTPDPDLDLGWDLDDADVESARPTVAPPFDLASYAKESMVPASDGGDVGAPPAAETPRPSQVPSLQALLSGKGLSLPPPPPLPSRGPPPRSIAPGALRSSQRPPQLNFPTPLAVVSPVAASADREGLAAFSSIITPLPPSSSPPSQRITPREMQRLEAAVAQSKEMLGGKDKAPESTGQPARADSVLAMANLRAPLLTPLRVPAVVAPSGAPPKPREASVPVPAVTDPVVEMQERFALGDYSGALVMAESMLDENPTHVEAREYAESCRSVLQQMYTARIGPLDRVPVVDIASDQLRWLSIDHRTGFILSLVDGVSSLEMILDVSGMAPLDALRMLFELVQQRIISVREE